MVFSDARENIDFAELDALGPQAAAGGSQAHDGAASHAFAGTGFANNTEFFRPRSKDTPRTASKMPEAPWKLILRSRTESKGLSIPFTPASDQVHRAAHRRPD